jgi:site-specific DNA-methyltransferase (adenine-specific)
MSDQKTDDATGHEFRDRVFCTDNLELMASLPSASCDLIYADPPFLTEQTRRGPSPSESDPSVSPRDEISASTYAFTDSFGGSRAAYMEFLRERFAQMHRLLSPQGSLYVHLDWRTVHEVKVMLDCLFGVENFLNEIIWSYRSGSRPARWFARKHDTLLLYAKQAGSHVFHALRGGTYRTQDLKRDEEGRPYKSTKQGRLYFDSRGPLVSDVWDIPMLSTVARERTGYPTQKPEALLERVVEASSSPGSVVADFFCGSGTTLAVAKRMGRRYLGCDANPAAVRLAESRLEATVVGGRPSEDSEQATDEEHDS